ncbi:MAG: sulfite exporter TauE/SafE family protein [Zoogloeaceae bacterium]|nr:sulfite exporter TauE/SafE family protein [Zoogloeaceae bacterium]
MPFDPVLLGSVAFFAGIVDAVVGGGGLIQVPVLLGHFPNASIPTLFGTNKVSSIAGTGAAMWRFTRSVPIPWRIVLPAALMALAGAWIGAAIVAWLPREAMKPLVLVLMIAVAFQTFRRKDFGHAATREVSAADRPRAVAFGGAMGVYDGFFGPGTGSLLIFGFVRLFGMDLLRASASAKVINAATNVSAIAFFASHGPLLWSAGLLMAACNLVGAQVGTWLALRHGTGFVRKAFLVVVLVLIAKLAWELLPS